MREAYDVKVGALSTDAPEMSSCGHGMDPGWCYPCRIESSGVSARAAWGLDTAEHAPDVRHGGPMAPDQAEELRFLCAEFDVTFDPSLTEGEAAIVVHSFLDEPPSDEQERSLGWLCERVGAQTEPGLTYGKARSSIRRFIALRGLRSA
jgi:hypothetical protein